MTQLSDVGEARDPDSVILETSMLVRNTRKKLTSFHLSVLTSLKLHMPNVSRLMPRKCLDQVPHTEELQLLWR